MRIVAWLDSLRADAVFGWRQLNKRRVTSAAAILSLALAIGSCTSAFRIVNALFLRPLPIANPERLYELTRAGKTAGWTYTAFRQMRPTVKDAEGGGAAKQQRRHAILLSSELTVRSPAIGGAYETLSTADESAITMKHEQRPRHGDRAH